MTSPPAPLFRVDRWQVWRVPSSLLGAMLAVELLAGALTLSDLVLRPDLDPATLGLLVTLAVAGVLHTEIVVGIERIRRYTADTHHVNLTSIWTLAAALLLPPSLGAVVVIVVYSHLYWRVLRPVPLPDRRPAYREVYNASTVIVAVHGAAAITAATGPGGVYEGLPPILGLVLALLVYTVVNTCLVLGAVAIVNPETRILQILFGGDELVLELATLCLGALTAVAMLTVGPLAAVLAVPPIIVLHRTIQVRHLREKADLDAKTGLLNHAAWSTRSAHALQVAERERRQAALLILDLDHFKEINDTHGHLYGDQVLAATAQVLREELRDHDLVGRFGGEEFVVLLPRLSGYDGRDEVRQIAERLRTRVSGRQDRNGGGIETPDGGSLPIRGGLGITVSIGGALFPADGTGTTALLEVADSALYAAKRAGRDSVRIGRHQFPAPELP